MIGSFNGLTQQYSMGSSSSLEVFNVARSFSIFRGNVFSLNDFRVKFMVQSVLYRV